MNELHKRKASIILLTKNGKPYIRDCLNAVFKQESPFTFEVICVDSGSTDGTLAIFKQYPIKLYKITPESFDHGLTRNFAISKAKGEYIVLLTQDAIPADNRWLNTLLENFKDELVAGVYCRQLPRQTDDPLLKRRINGFLSARDEKVISYIEDFNYYQTLTPLEKFIFCYFDNVCSCIRKKIWERFPFSATDFAEDLIWSKKILENGYKIIYEPVACVFHSHKRSFAYQFRRYYVHFRMLYNLFNYQELSSLSSVIEKSIKQIIQDIVYLTGDDISLVSMIKLWSYGIIDSFILNIAKYKAVLDVKNQIYKKIKI